MQLGNQDDENDLDSGKRQMGAMGADRGYGKQQQCKNLMVARMWGTKLNDQQMITKVTISMRTK
jgi:hypothetical protein